MKIIRVFPRRTKATPDDDLVRVAVGPTLFDEADEVHVSVAFSWDLGLAERLAEAWRCVGRVRVGGPATGEPGGDFEPGMYLRRGYVITSRGCPNRCWFCDVWRREGPAVRELPIREGTNVLDDNLLACSFDHIMAVFKMLARVRTSASRVHFTGGFEAARLRPWHVEAMKELHPHQIFFAYDNPANLPALRRAADMVYDGGLFRRGGSHRLRAFVLVGYPKDTFVAATSRMHEALDAGFTPMAMLYRDRDGKRDPSWARWQRQWARPAIIHTTLGRRG